MKTVYLLRHAKSSWNHPTLSDYDRPLSPRGRKAAPRMGAHMAREGFLPDRVLCSGAQRARESWELVEEAMGAKVAAQIMETLYHAGPGDILTLLHGVSSKAGSVLVVGHNPALEDLALALVATGDPKALQRLESKFPTGALAILDFPAQSWKEVREGRGHLRAFVRPKDVK